MARRRIDFDLAKFESYMRDALKSIHACHNELIRGNDREAYQYLRQATAYIRAGKEEADKSIYVGSPTMSTYDFIFEAYDVLEKRMMRSASVWRDLAGFSGRRRRR